ncbi:LuxR family transcriptional regulator [Caulobacter vibrioides]|nr:LuxR family transcriptional regulator [Caulobacter vibrioides]
MDDVSTGGADLIRVLVVDDHPMLRDGIVGLVDRQSDMRVVGEAADGVQALEAFTSLRPDITLMDIQMPGLDGVAAIERIRGLDPRAIVIVLTTYPGDTLALRALKAGAGGYLLKNCIRKDLLDTIRNVHAGRRILSPEIAQEIALHALEEPLSDRERVILLQVAEGRANKEIARRMSVSPDTIKACLKTIYLKLDVGDRTQAVVAALRRGYIGL